MTQDITPEQWQQFTKCQQQRSHFQLSSSLNQILNFYQHIIHIQNGRNSRIKQKNKISYQTITQQLITAFKTFNNCEKLLYYGEFVGIISDYLNSKQRGFKILPKGTKSGECFSRSFNLKMWKNKSIQLLRESGALKTVKFPKTKIYPLSNYLLRRSKTKQYFTFVLQAINNKPPQKSRTVHLGFKQQHQFNLWFKQLQDIYKIINWNFIHASMDKISNLPNSALNQNGHKASQGSLTPKILDGVGQQNQINSSNNTKQCNKNNQSNSNQKNMESNQKTIIQPKSELPSIKSTQNNNKSQNTNYPTTTKTQTIVTNGSTIPIQQKVQSKQKKQSKSKVIIENTFYKLMPDYDLSTLAQVSNYKNIFQQKNFTIMGHLQQPTKIKMLISLPPSISPQHILNTLTDSQTLKKVNNEIEQLSIKTLIKSQNSMTTYLKIKAYNRLYRPRDFIVFRHAFRSNNKTYLIDKSIQDLQYPPFTTIVRGDLCIIWCIANQLDKCTLIADTAINNQGYLNDSQNINLTLKMLKPFIHLQDVIQAQLSSLQSYSLLSSQYENIEKQLDDKKQQLQAKGKTKIQQKQQQIFKQQDQFHEQNTNQLVLNQTNFLQILKQIKLQQSTTKQIKSIEQCSKIECGQIDENELQQQQKLKNQLLLGIHRNFNEEGNVIIDKNYLKIKHNLYPSPKKQTQYQDIVKGHPIWKGQWIHDDKNGGIIFVNKKIIQQQKTVLKFIFTKIFKNALSGKSVLNISLPVDIFLPKSNLQLLAHSLKYAPTHLQAAANLQNPLEKFKKVIAFGMTHSSLYINTQKPFNPILGQTFQCWIDGCPLYAQQICHHPPIAALLYYGRGFTLNVHLQSQMQLHVNGGYGINHGIFKIKFDDGFQACYTTPGGEISGLLYGDRKFNLSGKSYYWSQSQNMFLQLSFNPYKKGFFSVGRQVQPIDYFEGTLCRVKRQFIESFLTKKRAPTDKQLVQKLGKVTGIWNKYTQHENQIILDIDNQFPVKLHYERNPLPSDSNWRQDISYLRILQVNKAQQYKQKLQIQQRKDRKLRQQYKHHTKQ